MTRPGGLLRLLAWVMCLGAVIVGLHGLGGPLAPPPLNDLGRLDRWVEQREPAEAFVALLRLLTLGTAWYLLAATVVAAVARLSGLPGLMAAADVVSVPLVRRLAGGALGLSMVATSVAGTAFATPQSSTTAPTTMAPTMRRLPDVPPDPPAGHEEPPVEASDQPDQPDQPDLPDQPGEPGEPGASWEVKPGEHFWAVATAVLGEAWQRPPTDREVDPYWRALIEANRSVLRDRDNPNLLFPGQVLTVPAPPQPR